MEVHPVGVDMFHTDGRTDRHNEINSCFRNFADTPKNQDLVRCEAMWVG